MIEKGFQTEYSPFLMGGNILITLFQNYDPSEGKPAVKKKKKAPVKKPSEKKPATKKQPAEKKPKTTQKKPAPKRKPKVAAKKESVKKDNSDASSVSSVSSDDESSGDEEIEQLKKRLFHQPVRYFIL